MPHLAKLPPTEQLRKIAAAEPDLTLDDLTARYGCSKPAATKACQRAGITLKRKRYTSRIVPDDRQLLKGFFAKSLPELAKEYGVTVPALMAHRKRIEAQLGKTIEPLATQGFDDAWLDAFCRDLLDREHN